MGCGFALNFLSFSDSIHVYRATGCPFAYSDLLELIMSFTSAYQYYREQDFMLIYPGVCVVAKALSSNVSCNNCLESVQLFSGPCYRENSICHSFLYLLQEEKKGSFISLDA